MTTYLAGGLALLVTLGSIAEAQVLPAQPLRFADGRLIISGEATASTSSDDDPGYFNYTDYEHNALRLLRLGVSVELRVSDRVSVLSEVRTENWDRLKPYALFVRVRPWSRRAFDIQAGRIPPTFGTFARQGYGRGNLLIGYPLAYQYLTSLRPDALPLSADDVLRMRGRGWLVSYPIGASGFDQGLPLVTAFRWDTGVQVRIGTRPVEVGAAITNGTLSNPRVSDDNDGKQVSARLALRPYIGLVVGLSAARGDYISRGAVAGLPPEIKGSRQQSAVGVDGEYSRDHWLVRGEAIFGQWQVPTAGPPRLTHPLRALGLSVEGRYTLRPGLYAAARIDRLTFSRIAGTLFGGQPTSWDAPVSRIEVGGGYYLQRNVVAKLAYQHNWRDGGRIRTSRSAVAQISYWF